MQLEENETAVNNPNKEVYTLAHCFKAQISKLMAKKYVGSVGNSRGTHIQDLTTDIKQKKIYLFNFIRQ
jgi:hypothetical protein